jgi:hypothetical protein
MRVGAHVLQLWDPVAVVCSLFQAMKCYCSENFISFRSRTKMKMHQLRNRLTWFLETRTHHPGVDVDFTHRVKESHSNLHAPSIAIPGHDMNLLVVIINAS